MESAVVTAAAVTAAAVTAAAVTAAAVTAAAVTAAAVTAAAPLPESVCVRHRRRLFMTSREAPRIFATLLMM